MQGCGALETRKCSYSGVRDGDIEKEAATVQPWQSNIRGQHVSTSRETVNVPSCVEMTGSKNSDVGSVRVTEDSFNAHRLRIR